MKSQMLWDGVANKFVCTWGSDMAMNEVRLREYGWRRVAIYSVGEDPLDYVEPGNRQAVEAILKREVDRKEKAQPAKRVPFWWRVWFLISSW